MKLSDAIQRSQNKRLIQQNKTPTQPIEQKENNLECICLLVTGSELDDGLFDRFLSEFEKTSASSKPEILDNINFTIFHKNTKEIEKKDLSLIKNKFKNFSLVEMKIPSEYDFYLRENTMSKIKNINLYNLKYGLKSGANYSFFKAIDFFKNFNTTLFLECDCFFGENWLEKIYNFTKYSGGFWIAGSVYDNEKTNLSNQVANTHLNGGISLYATSNSYFRNFMEESLRDFFQYVLAKPNIPYDYFIKQRIDDCFDTDIENRYYWNFVKRQYIKCNLICNYSPKRDQRLDLNYLRKRHNFSIMHKK